MRNKRYSLRQPKNMFITIEAPTLSRAVKNRRNKVKAIIDQSFQDIYGYSDSQQNQQPVHLGHVNSLVLPQIMRFFQYNIVRQIGRGKHYNYFLAIDTNRQQCLLKRTINSKCMYAYYQQARYCDSFFGKGKQKTKFNGFYNKPTNLVILLRKFSSLNQGWLLYKKVNGIPILTTLLISKKEIINQQHVISYKLKCNAQHITKQTFYELVKKLCEVLIMFQKQGVIHTGLVHQKIMVTISQGTLKSLQILPTTHAIITKPIKVQGHDLQYPLLPQINYFKRLRLANLPPEILIKLKQKKQIRLQDVQRLDKWMIGIYLYQIMTLSTLDQQVKSKFQKKIYSKGPLAGIKDLSDLIQRQKKLLLKIQKIISQRDVWNIPESSYIVSSFLNNNMSIQQILKIVQSF